MIHFKIQVRLLFWHIFLVPTILLSNANFFFDSIDQLILDDFNAVTEIEISQSLNDLKFELSSGVWNGTNIGGMIAVDGSNPSLLHVNTDAFENVRDQLDIQLLNTSGIDLDVIFTSNVDFPNSPTNGIFYIDVNGSVVVGGSLITNDNDLLGIRN